MALPKTIEEPVRQFRCLSINLTNEQTKEPSTGQKNSGRILRLLGDAIETKDKLQVQKCLEENTELNPTVLGSLLWTAIQKGAVEIASMLVKAGSDLKLTKPSDGQKSSFLHELVAGEDQIHHQLAILMMEHGAEINACDKQGRSVIFRAIERKSSVYIIEELLKRQVRVKDNLIDLAIRHPFRIQVLPMLLNSGLFNDNKRVELVACAISDIMCLEKDESLMLPIVKVLLDMKLPISEIERDGLTLDNAISCNHVKMVQLLIEYGFDVNRPILGIMLPLYAASSKQKSIITEMLIHAGAKVNGRAADHQALDGRYPLHVACQSRSIANIQVLLRNGADVNATDSKGRTPFSLLLSYGYIYDAHKEVIKYLAIYVSKGRKISDHDSKLVESRPEWLAYYTQCLNELETMKVTKIINNISFHACFNESMMELAFLSRNSNFVKCYDLLQRKSYFPIYHEEMDMAMEKAIRHKELLSDREEALCKSLENILPCIPLDIIVHHFYFVDIE